jgi:hydroxymethylbilane synthase
VEAERAMNRALHGSCHVPVAAIAQWQGDDLHLQGLVGSASDGLRCAPKRWVRPVTRMRWASAWLLLDAGAGELLNV